MATRNELGRLPIKLAIETSIIKFWIHLQSLPENNIAKQCLQLSKEMADKNQSGLMQKIDQLCIKYNSSSITEILPGTFLVEFVGVTSEGKSVAPM